MRNVKKTIVASTVGILVALGGAVPATAAPVEHRMGFGSEWECTNARSTDGIKFVSGCKYDLVLGWGKYYVYARDVGDPIG